MSKMSIIVDTNIYDYSVQPYIQNRLDWIIVIHRNYYTWKRFDLAKNLSNDRILNLYYNIITY